MQISNRFKRALLISFAVGAVSLILVENDIAHLINLHGRPTKFVTSSGALDGVFRRTTAERNNS